MRDFSRRIRHLRFAALRLIDGLESGHYRSLFPGLGVDLREVREYAAGDELRHIDWKVTSRLGSPYSKVFQEERELSLMFLLDLSSSMFIGRQQKRKIEQMLHIFALLGFAATLNGDCIGSLLYNQQEQHYFKPRRDRRAFSKQLNVLLNCSEKRHLGRNAYLNDACRIVCERLSRRGSCVILSDFRYPNEEHKKALSLLASRHHLLLIRLVDPQDYDFPRSGLHTFLDCETKKLVTIFGASLRMRHNYALYWEQQWQLWKQTAASLKVPCYEISTEENVEQRLLQIFRKKNLS